MQGYPGASQLPANESPFRHSWSLRLAHMCRLALVSLPSSTRYTVWKRIPTARGALLPTRAAAWGHGLMERRSGRPLYLHEDLVPGSYGLLVCVPVYSQDHSYPSKEFWSPELPISVTCSG